MAKRKTKLVRDTATDFLAGLFIFFAVYGIALLDSRQAWPAPTETTLWQVHHQENAVAEPFGQTLGLNRPSKSGWSRDALPQREQFFTSSPSKTTGTKIAQLKQSRPDYAPQSAAANSRVGALAAMALFFAAMCAVTMGFWRHIRRAYASPRRN